MAAQRSNLKDNGFNGKGEFYYLHNLVNFFNGYLIFEILNLFQTILNNNSNLNPILRMLRI